MLVAEYTRKNINSQTGSSSLTDEQLVVLAKNGDRLAFKELVEKYQQRIFYVAQRILGSANDAEDIVQESFVKAYLSIASFKGDSAFYSWLYRIAYNMALDERRRRARKGGQHENLEGLDQVLDSGVVDNPEMNTAAKQELKLLNRALNKLSPEHKEVLVMREIDGLAYEEIASTLGVSLGTVMSRLFYARKNLMKLLPASEAQRKESERLRLVQS